jgi:predicted MFS family arabinose efflux permease
MTVASVVGALSTDYTVVLISRVVFAAASAVVTPTTLSVVAFLTTPEARGKAISKVFGGFALSNVIGLPLGVMIAAVSDWHVALWYAAIVSAAAALMVGKYLPRNIQVPPSNFAILWAFILDWRKMAVVSIIVLQMAAVFTVYTYLTAWLTVMLGLSQQAVTLMLLWFGLFGTIGVFSSGELMRRFNNHRLMVFLLIALAVIHSSFSWIPAFIPPVMLALALWGLFGFAFQPAQQTRVIQVAGTSANAGITLHASGVYVGQAFGAFVGGAMLAGGGMSSLGWAAAVGAMAALGLMLITFQTTRNQIPAK